MNAESWSIKSLAGRPTSHPMRERPWASMTAECPSTTCRLIAMESRHKKTITQHFVVRAEVAFVFRSLPGTNVVTGPNRLDCTIQKAGARA
jgi:hypothetical protein